jgi:hypothetical protein
MKKKNNNKILPATSTCCGAVVRNECMDHFSSDKEEDRGIKNSCIESDTRLFPLSYQFGEM